MTQLDHVIFLGGSRADDNDKMKNVIKSFLRKYREVVNPDLLYTDVDFLMSSSSFTYSDTSDGKDVYLGGNTTQLIKFVAERSSGGQLAYIENIDVKYDLNRNTNTHRYNNLKISPVQENVPKLPLFRVPKWHTVRIFISSTFKDMHSERDMLIRFVMPELRKRAASIFIKINEVDLRWGITETDCASKRAAELCLLEAQKSDFFIGLIGDRYGTIYNFDSPEAPELQWVKEYPKGLSITELEMHAGALRENKLKEKRAFFYFRDNVFMSLVPEKWKSYFDSEDPESKQKVEALKSKILLSGVKVNNGYCCHFAGLLNGKPVLSDLESFGKNVLIDMWNAVKKMHEEDPYVDDFMEEEICQQHLSESLDHVVEIKDSPMENLIKQIRKDSGIFLITGAPGSGKTTFVVNMIQKLKNFTIVKFYVGLSPRSTELSFMLQYISNSIANSFPVSSVFPKLNSDVMNQFPDILQEAVSSSGNSEFALVIDGLDHLPIDDQVLDWLPLNLPQGLRLICTASDSSFAFKVLCDRQTHGTHVQIQALSAIGHSDREYLVKKYLQLYGKTLDESSFNNQMLKLVTKKDSGIPLYLRMACDFLRRYASFENFMSMLQSLPSAMSLLLKEIILQMENEFGSSLVQTALILLCITKEGLDDADLHFLLSLVLLEKEKGALLTFKSAVDQIAKLKPDNMLSQVTYCSLVHTICSFAYGHNRFKKFTLIGSEFEKAAEKFYVNKNYQNFSKSMHCSLAAYYYTICDPEKDGTWQGRSGSAFRGLVFHLFNGRCYLELVDYFCCLRFLEAIFSVEAGSFILEYYSLLFDESHTGSNEIARKINFPLLSSFYDFVSRNLHIFQTYPNLVLQQALNEPSESLVKLNVEINDSYKPSIVKCLTRLEQDPRIATLSGFFKNITAASYENVTRRVLLGSEDGCLKVLDVASKKIIRSIKSHTSSITSICFAGKNRICTASTDTTLSLWSSTDYTRISVLKGHKHIVSGCCGDSSNSILLSSGWDNSVRLWSLRDGSFISVIDFECPVNCLDHHPQKQQVVCGLWNGNLEIWDTVSLQRNNILPSNSSSVKSIAYTSDGINIISSYINSDVIIWSSELGLKISSLKGHTLPVKSISYSPLGDVIVSGSDDCTLKVWPTESGLPLRTFSACKFCPVSLLEIISPNYLAVGFQNSDIWILDMNTGCIVSKMAVDADIISCFSKFESTTYVSKEKSWVDVSVVFGTQSGKILVGNISSSEITTVGNVQARITTLIHNTSIIVCGNCEGGIGLFSYPELSCRVVKGAHSGSITALSLFSEDNNVWIMSTGSDKRIKLWEIDFEEIAMKEEFYSKHNDIVTCCCKYYGSNEKQSCYLTGSHDNTVILESEDYKSVFEGLKTSVINIAYSNNCIVGCGSDGSIALWSKDGKLLSYTPGIEQSSIVLSFRIDEDISNEFDITLAFVDKDGSVKIQKPNQRSFSYSLEGHSKSITSCCLSQNQEILSCSLDGTVNLWKLPTPVQDINVYHSASVTGICVSLSQKTVISSDAHGNIVLWKLVFSTSTENSLVFAGKKSYIGGFVKAVSFLKEKKFVCAVNDSDKYFLDILSYDCSASSDDSLYSLQINSSHPLKSEVLCLDTDPKTETIVAGLKSGNFMVITPNTKKILTLSEDWVLGVKLLSSSDGCVEYLFTSLLNGSIKRIQMSEINKCKDYDRVSLEEIGHTSFGSDVPYISSFCCESDTSVYCGDSQGWLRKYSDVPVSKKIHDDSITGISVVGCYIFTCSVDRTLKGWDSTLKQVCQFHSSVPITGIVGREIKLKKSLSSYMLIIGTSSGAVQFLHFHDNKVS
ncbi:telomerase protein component 1 [Nephila pilipes]|uniref:Telomerase protein component 1 n=1 Tax=Nephila pilipes TaxID=299642 RepID=A0A8X6N724_NEPPI|nr:telomerase protein component 1 [Nephila pilipes]